MVEGKSASGGSTSPLAVGMGVGVGASTGVSSEEAVGGSRVFGRDSVVLARRRKDGNDMEVLVGERKKLPKGCSGGETGDGDELPNDIRSGDAISGGGGDVRSDVRENGFGVKSWVRLVVRKEAHRSGQGCSACACGTDASENFVVE